MKERIVQTPSKQYPIYITQYFDRLADAFSQSKIVGKRAIIVSDSNVAPLYLKTVLEICNDIFTHCHTFTFEAGEESKTLSTIESMYQSFFLHKLDRKSVVIALGGGVTGDMAGFAAATYMRGLPFVQIPTTLLSQVDSSVGGKTGVDFMGAKNIIGAFYQPEFVYMATSVLETLSDEHFSSGMAEVIKHGLIQDKEQHYFSYLENHRNLIQTKSSEAIAHVLDGSCRIKSEVVGQDERESGLREILNFGHTFGHAIESLLEFSLPHGHCVSLGIMGALYASEARGNLIASDVHRAKNLLHSYGLPTSLKNTSYSISVEAIYDEMFHDKKAVDSHLSFVLLQRLGVACRVADLSEQEVKAAIRYILD